MGQIPPAFPVWNSSLIKPVTEHLSLLIHMHIPLNAPKHTIEIDCIMLRFFVYMKRGKECVREYPCAHVVFTYKGMIDAACWLQQWQQEEEQRREQESKEEQRMVDALLPLTLITQFSFSHEYWALVTVHEQRGWIPWNYTIRDLWISSKYKARTHLVASTTQLNNKTYHSSDQKLSSLEKQLFQLNSPQTTFRWQIARVVVGILRLWCRNGSTLSMTLKQYTTVNFPSLILYINWTNP